ncbi:hypothetical protein BN961_02175 [Afipia felis]|uniref:Uncharacterized protein n=1 Tax=Afipia felis TaxID=1035 RepID=A0A090MR90_AFIFE|nr:hypothetical protein [Afipia felis]CEG08757.1 hypothetical protein BN961_02175 [Afipia felis]
MAEPIVLIKADDPERKPQLYACAKCGSVHSPRIYICTDELAHKTARDAAENCYNCRTHNTCQHCGEPCDKHWLACEKCRRKKKLEEAEKVSLDGVDYCFGFDSGDFYSSPEEAADAGEDWVHLAKFRPFEIDIDRLEEHTLDDHHEDACHTDLVGWDELAAAIEKFNKAQTQGSYDEDSKRIASVAHLREEEDLQPREATHG